MMCVFLCRCKSLILLETYTTNKSEDFKVPPFLEVQSEVTGDLDYSMFNLSKKLDSESFLASAPHDDPTKGKSEIGSEVYAIALEAETKDGVPSLPTGSVLDSTKDHSVKNETALEPSTKVVVDSLLNGRKNGYHCNDISRDQLTTLPLNKLDSCHSSAAVMSGMLSEDGGHIFLGDVADYERFAQLCRSGKTGAAVK